MMVSRKDQLLFLKSLHKQEQSKLEMVLYLLENLRDKAPEDDKMEQAILDELERRRQDAQ